MPSSVVVSNLNIECVPVFPAKADTVLIVNATLYCPARSPFSASSRFAGGDAKSRSSSALSIWTSLRSTTVAICWNLLTRCWWKIDSVSLSRKERIKRLSYYGSRYTWSVRPAADGTAVRAHFAHTVYGCGA